MNKINKMLVALLLIVYSSATTFASVSEIDVCKKLDIDGEYYLLAANVESPGTCFIIGANNVTLDGAGHYVNFSGLTYGYGIYNSRHDNVIIKNMIINQVNVSPPYPGYDDSYVQPNKRNKSLIDSVGINFFLSKNGLISNVTTNVSRESIILTSSNNNTIIDSTAISIRSAAIFIYNSSNNKIINSIGMSTITDKTKSFEYERRSAGIQWSLSSNNTVINSTGISNIGMGIQIGGLNNIIQNSTGISNSNIGIDLYKSSNNVLTFNKGISNMSYGLHLISSSNNIISNSIGYSNSSDGIILQSSNNNIISYSTGSSNENAGIKLDSFSDNNTISYSTGISNSSLTVSSGISLDKSSNNTISNSTGRGLIVSNGIGLYKSSNNAISNSTGISNRGKEIYLGLSYNNTINMENFTPMSGPSYSIENKGKDILNENIIITALLILILSFIIVVLYKK